MSEISYETLQKTNAPAVSATPFLTRSVKVAVQAWFGVAAVGHWIFLAYILAVFYPPLATLGLAGLEGLHLPSGFRDGDTLGNLAAASHLLLAAVVIGGGPLQLIPALRKTCPAFHRYLGRAYLSAAVTSGAGGLYMIWTRGTVGNTLNHVGTSGDAILIFIFAAFAIHHAIARRIALHQRWALRLFMAASAVWFYRVGLMGWLATTGGLGVDFETFTGPFLDFLGFAQYLLPLAMLEWYFRIRRLDAGIRSGQVEHALFASSLFALTAFMAVGIFAATMGMWLPRIT